MCPNKKHPVCLRIVETHMHSMLLPGSNCLCTNCSLLIVKCTAQDCVEQHCVEQQRICFCEQTTPMTTQRAARRGHVHMLHSACQQCMSLTLLLCCQAQASCWWKFKMFSNTSYTRIPSTCIPYTCSYTVTHFCRRRQLAQSCMPWVLWMVMKASRASASGSTCKPAPKRASKARTGTAVLHHCAHYANLCWTTAMLSRSSYYQPYSTKFGLALHDLCAFQRQAVYFKSSNCGSNVQERCVMFCIFQQHAYRYHLKSYIGCRCCAAHVRIANTLIPPYPYAAGIRCCMRALAAHMMHAV